MNNKCISLHTFLCTHRTDFKHTETFSKEKTKNEFHRTKNAKYTAGIKPTQKRKRNSKYCTQNQPNNNIRNNV